MSFQLPIAFTAMTLFFREHSQFVTAEDDPKNYNNSSSILAPTPSIINNSTKQYSKQQLESIRHNEYDPLLECRRENTKGNWDEFCENTYIAPMHSNNDGNFQNFSFTSEHFSCGDSCTSSCKWLNARETQCKFKNDQIKDDNGHVSHVNTEVLAMQSPLLVLDSMEECHSIDFSIEKTGGKKFCAALETDTDMEFNENQPAMNSLEDRNDSNLFSLADADVINGEHACVF